MRRVAVILFEFAMATGACAQVAMGRWVMRESPENSMVVDPMGAGYRFAYHIVGSDGKPITMTLQTPLDGSQMPFLLGSKPTGQSHAGKRIDSRHTSGVIKMNGKVLPRPGCPTTARR